jgi:glycosyltransferase involved in cell wall biosynthesis
MHVLAFGSYDARRHPRGSVLLDGLRAAGASVTECNAPLGLDTAARVRLLREPWRLPSLAVRLLRTWATLVRRARRLPVPDVVLVPYLGHFDVLLARRLFRSSTVVHDMLLFAASTAQDRGAGHVRQRLLRRLDLAAVRASDVVVVDTEEHLQLLPPERRADGVVVPFGTTRNWLAPAAPAPVDGCLRVVFFGLFTPLQGTPTLGRALALLAGRPDVRVDVVGSGQDLEECRRLAGDRAEVTWRTWVDGAELPAFVADHHVCLGIFGSTEKARRVVPTKVFQGAAAGCAVVTSDTPPQRRMLGDAAVYVPPEDAESLATALRELADDPSRLLALRRAAWQLAVDRFLPETVVQPLLHRLPGDLPGGVPRSTSEDQP